MGTAVMVLCGQEVLHTSTLQFGLLSTGAAIGACVGGWTASAITKRIGSGASVGADAVARRRRHDRSSGSCRNWVVVGLLLVVTMFVGRAVERHHGEPAPGGDPRPPPRPRQQRLPVLRLGGDPDRRPARWCDRRRPGRAHCRGSGRCGCRGSSPESPSSCWPPSSPGSLTQRPDRRGPRRAGRWSDPVAVS